MHWTSKSLWDEFEPLHPNQWDMQALKESWHKSKSCVIDNFARTYMLFNARQEAVKLKHLAFETDTTDHQGRYFQHFIAADHLAPENALLRLWRDTTFKLTLQEITGIEWHEYADPLSGCVISYFHEGNYLDSISAELRQGDLAFFLDQEPHGVTSVVGNAPRIACRMTYYSQPGICHMSKKHATEQFGRYTPWHPDTPRSQGQSHV